MASTRTSRTAAEDSATTTSAGVDTTPGGATEAQEAQTTDATPDAPSTDASLRIKYTGSTMHTRVLENQDFKNAGLEGVGKQTWGPDNGHTVDFSEAENKDGIVKFLTEAETLKGLDGKPMFKVLSAGEV